MANLIDDLLNTLDIVEVVQRYVPLKKAWSNFAGCCPFHNEKTPSFMVSPHKQIFKCFGCGKGGNVFTFIQEIERIDFRDAVRELAKQQNIDISHYEKSPHKREKNADEKEKIKRIHSITQKFFVEQLKSNPKVQAYLLQERKLNSEFIDHFGIGFAPDKHYELLQMLRKKGFTDTDLLEASLAKKNANGEVYGFFRNRITFPIYDTMNNVIWFSARVVNPDDKPKYINSAEHRAFEKSKILYGLNFAKEAIRTEEKLIVVEGQMDVIGLAKLGYPIGVASSWTSLTEQHIKLLKRYTENIYLLFDNDNAWKQAIMRALGLFYQNNMFPKVISISSSVKDIDELSNLAEGKELFSQSLAHAEDWFLWAYHDLRETLDSSSPVDKQRLIMTLFELIINVQSLTIQEHYKNLLAEKLWFAPEILNAEFKRYKNNEGRILIASQIRRQEQEKKASYEIQRDQLLASLFHENAIDHYIIANEQKTAFTQFVSLLWEQNPDTVLGKVFLNTLSESEQQQLDELELRRENQLDSLDEERKYQQILQTLQSYLQSLLKTTLKTSKINDQQKKELLELRKKL